MPSPKEKLHTLATENKRSPSALQMSPTGGSFTLAVGPNERKRRIVGIKGEGA